MFGRIMADAKRNISFSIIASIGTFVSSSPSGGEAILAKIYCKYNFQITGVGSVISIHYQSTEVCIL